MKTLIAYYSRTGTTKKVAQELAKILKCDIEEIIDTKDRLGAVGYLLSGRDATKGKLTKLQPIKKDPSKYDSVIVGTPIWAWNVSTPVRTYLAENKTKFGSVAFFCTQGGSGAEKACEEMESICGKKPVAKLALLTKEVVAGKFKEKLTAFSKLVKTCKEMKNKR